MVKDNNHHNVVFQQHPKIHFDILHGNVQKTRLGAASKNTAQTRLEGLEGATSMVLGTISHSGFLAVREEAIYCFPSRYTALSTSSSSVYFIPLSESIRFL